MVTIAACEPPPGSVIEAYRAAGEYTDCFTCSVPNEVTLSDYIEAFYSSRAFWIERQGL